MSLPKKIYLWRDFSEAFSVWGALPSYDPILPPPHTLYVYAVYLFTQGGGRANQREG